MTNYPIYLSRGVSVAARPHVTKMHVLINLFVWLGVMHCSTLALSVAAETGTQLLRIMMW